MRVGTGEQDVEKASLARARGQCRTQGGTAKVRQTQAGSFGSMALLLRAMFDGWAMGVGEASASVQLEVEQVRIRVRSQQLAHSCHPLASSLCWR